MKEIITKYYNLYGLNDYEWDVWLSSVTYFILIFISYKLLEKYTPKLARLVHFWLWEIPWLLGLIIFWTSLATIIILVIINYFYPLQDEVLLYQGIFVFGFSVFCLSKFHKYIDGPHWYKLKYIKLNEFDQCIYRCDLTDKGLDNKRGCYVKHEYKCLAHYEQLKEKGTIEPYLEYYSKNENLINE